MLVNFTVNILQQHKQYDNKETLQSRFTFVHELLVPPTGGFGTCLLVAGNNVFLI